MSKSAIENHRDAVALYEEVSRIASAHYPDPLAEEQRDAYLLLPYMLNLCRDAYSLLDPDIRPVHYLLAGPYARRDGQSL